MKNSVLLVLALGIGLPVHGMSKKQAATAPLTREQILEAIEKVTRDQARAAKSVDDKFDAESKSRSQKIDDEIWQIISKENAKKYGLNNRIAQLRVQVPYSLPLVKEMFIAADQHNKEKLRDLVANYLAAFYGDDWRKQLEMVDGDIRRRRLNHVMSAQGFLSPDFLRGLAALYFKEKLGNVVARVEGDIIIEHDDQTDRLIKELGLEDPSFSYKKMATLPTKKNIEDALSQLPSTFSDFPQIQDKYSKWFKDEFAKVNQKVNQHLIRIATKSNEPYGLPPRVAQIAFVPFSIPLIKEMFIAADAQNKDKLKELVSQYLAIIFGPDWRTRLAEFQDSVRIVTVDTTVGGVLGGLDTVYFRKEYKPRRTTEESTHEQADHLIKELFETE